MNETTQPAVAGPVEPTVRPLVERLRAGQNFYAESSLWFDSKLAQAVDEAADELERLSAELKATLRDKQAVLARASGWLHAAYDRPPQTPECRAFLAEVDQALFQTHPAVECQRAIESAVRPACGVDPLAKA